MVGERASSWTPRSGTGEVDDVHAGVVLGIQPVGELAQRMFRSGIGRRREGGHLAIEVLLRHVEHARAQVAPGVRQIGVVHLHHALHADVAVMAELHVAHEVVAVGVHAEDLHQVGGHDAVALRLRHLLALGQQEAVAEDVLGQRHAGSHEHGRPDDAVEARDVLAHEVVLHGPAGSNSPARSGSA